MKRVGWWLSMVCFGVLSGHLYAATWTWDGGSPTTDAWSDQTNWVGDSSIPVSDPNTDLIFGNSPRLYARNDLGWFTLRDLTFTATSAVWVVGDGLEIFRAVINSGSTTCVLGNPIALGADITVRAATANLVLGTNNTAGHTLRTEGSATVYLQSLTGNGHLEVHGPGQTVLLGSNAYSGATRVYGGTLLASGTDSLRHTTSLVVQGSSTAWLENAAGFFAAGTSGHHALVTNGGALLASEMVISSYAGRVEVQGAGSIITAEVLQVASSAQANAIEVSNGGTARFNQFVQLDGVCNTVHLDGANTLLDAPGVMVGAFGLASDQRIEVKNGARLNGGVFTWSGASGTWVVVQGTGSVLTGSGYGALAFQGRNEHAEIRDGGVLLAAAGMGGTRGEFILTGAGSAITGSQVGGVGGQENTFSVSDGARVDLPAFIVTGSSNRVEITGAGTVWTNGSIEMLDAGQSAVRVGSGATLHAPHFTMALCRDSTAVFDGPDTRVSVGAVTVSVSGASRMAITNGARLSSGYAAVVASYGDPSLLEIAGSGSAWQVKGNLDLGMNARVADGAQLITSSNTYAHYQPVQVDVTGRGSVWSNAGDMWLSAGSRLRVLDGGSLYSGRDLAAGGTTTVSGAGSLVTVAREWGVGNALNVVSGGSISVGSVLMGTASRLLLDGGTATVSTLTSAGGAIDFQSGTLNVSTTSYDAATALQVGDGNKTATLNLAGSKESVHRFAGGLIINPNAQLTGQGTLDNDVTVKGTLSPGNSAGTIAITGNLELDISAQTLIEIFGQEAGQFDVIQAGPSITYGGLLNVAFKGFTPTNGARFRIFEAAFYLGAFAQTNITGVGLAGFDSGSGEVFVINAIPEPGSLVLIVGGALLLYRRACHRRTPYS